MANVSGPAYKRRNYFINRKLQLRFMAGFSLAVFAGFILNLLLAYFLIDRELTEELYKIHIKIRTTSEIAAPVILKLSAVTIPSVLIISALIGYFLTRRIELPLLNFKEAVKKAAQGDFTRTLPDDMPGGLHEAFNRMAGSLGGRFRSLKKSINIIDKELQGIDMERAASRKEIADALVRVSKAREEAWEEVSRLKV